MSQTANMIMFYVFFALFSLSFLPWTSTGFTLELIHRDSPLSPLYQSNLSDFQRFIKNVDISIARASYLHQQHNKLVGNTNTSKVPEHIPSLYDDPLYTVQIGIGTPAVKKSMIFDTASGLTWTQCKPCITCYKEDKPIFDPKTSKSYKTLPKTHAFAKSFTCPKTECLYKLGYPTGGQRSAGVAATETFTFGTATIPNLVFGCGRNNTGKFPSYVSGIMGFDKDPYSFAQQLGGLIKNRFSYCINTASKHSFLKFGNEAVIKQAKNAHSTPFMSYKGKANMYALSLSDLSISGKKLGLGQAAFPNGCLIDSGVSYGQLNTKAFLAVKTYLESYFAKLNVKRFAWSEKPFICFQQPEGFKNLPGMTFHFKGADYKIPPERLFEFVKTNVFCMTMMQSNDVSILGAFQQQDVRVVYDLHEKKLSFAPEDCSKDVA